MKYSCLFNFMKLFIYNNLVKILRYVKKYFRYLIRRDYCVTQSKYFGFVVMVLKK